MVLDDLIAEKLINKRSADIQVTDEDVAATLKKFTGGAPDEQVKEQIERAAARWTRCVRTSDSRSASSAGWKIR
jgi:hypothetical protein